MMKDNIMKLDQLHVVIKQCAEMAKKKAIEEKRHQASINDMYEDDKDRKPEFGANMIDTNQKSGQSNMGKTGQGDEPNSTLPKSNKKRVEIGEEDEDVGNGYPEDEDVSYETMTEDRLETDSRITEEQQEDAYKGLDVDEGNIINVVHVDKFQIEKQLPKNLMRARHKAREVIPY